MWVHGNAVAGICPFMAGRLPREEPNMRHIYLAIRSGEDVAQRLRVTGVSGNDVVNADTKAVGIASYCIEVARMVRNGAP